MALRRARAACEHHDVAFPRLLEAYDLLAPGEVGACIEPARRGDARLLQAVPDEGSAPRHFIMLHLRVSATVLSSKWRCWPSFGLLVVSMPLAEIDSVRPLPREPDDLTSSTVPVNTTRTPSPSQPSATMTGAPIRGRTMRPSVSSISRLAVSEWVPTLSETVSEISTGMSVVVMLVPATVTINTARFDICTCIPQVTR